MPSIDVESEITGKVWKLVASVGTKVGADDVIMIIESMKMEIPVGAPTAGTVTELLVAEGDDVNEGQSVARIETAGR